MLRLSRKVGESIIISNNIEIQIIEIKGKIVKIGVKSPSNISVFREEVYEKIKRENLEAKNSDNNFVKNIVTAGE